MACSRERERTDLYDSSAAGVAKCVLSYANECSRKTMQHFFFFHFHCFSLLFPMFVKHKDQVDIHFATIYKLFTNKTKPLSVVPIQNQVLKELIQSL